MAQRAVGTKLQIGATAIAELTDIGGLDISADTIDTTSLDAVGSFKTFIQGLKDGGEVQISGFFNPGDAGNAALMTAYSNGTVDSYTILFPSSLGASWTFTGVMVGYKTDVKLADAVSFEAKIKVSGQPTLGLSASANLTALSGAGLTLAPVFAGGTYFYNVTTSATSYTITSTLATAQNISIYQNGALLQSGVASGSASQSISISGVGTTQMIDIVYNESGKSSKTYSLVVYKNA